MAIQWTTTEQASADAGVKALVYGDSGLGKTVLCATLPRPLIISNESGLLSLRKQNLERLFGVNTPGIAYNIPVMQIRNMAELIDAHRWVIGSAEMNNFDSIALDSLSEIAEVILANAKQTVKDPRQAYGDLITQTEQMVRSFRDIQGKHIYFAAKMEPMKDEMTGVVKYGPSMPGAKLGPKLPYFFDEVFRYGIGVDKDGKKFRYLQTEPDMQYIAKDRSGALGPMEYPHLGAAFRKIIGG